MVAIFLSSHEKDIAPLQMKNCHNLEQSWSTHRKTNVCSAGHARTYMLQRPNAHSDQASLRSLCHFHYTNAPDKTTALA
jgi:hypothetical protein